jgi:hypothetical protein
MALKKIYQTDTYIEQEFFVDPIPGPDGDEFFALRFESKDKDHILLNLKEWIRQIEQES